MLLVLRRGGGGGEGEREGERREGGREEGKKGGRKGGREGGRTEGGRRRGGGGEEGREEREEGGNEIEASREKEEEEGREEGRGTRDRGTAKCTHETCPFGEITDKKTCSRHTLDLLTPHSRPSQIILILHASSRPLSVEPIELRDQLAKKRHALAILQEQGHAELEQHQPDG